MIILSGVYLFGINSLSAILAQYIRDDSRYSIRGVTVNLKYCNYKEILGLPLVPFEDLPSGSVDFGIINCVGYSENLGVREFISSQITDKGIPLVSYIHQSAIVDGAEIGDGTIVMNNAVIEPYSRVGKGNVFYGGSYVCHHAIIGDYNWFSANAVLAGEVTVGNRNFFGVNSSVRERLKIGSMTTIGMGTVVIRDVPDNSVAIGNPATVRSQ